MYKMENKIKSYKAFNADFPLNSQLGKLGKIGEEGIKENTFYTLDASGEFVEY